MKLYCHCGLFVADIKDGSNIRKGAIMICQKCFERFKIADNLAQMANKHKSSADLPEFFKNIFDGKK